MANPPRFSFTRLLGEFLLAIFALTCWFLLQYVLIRPPGQAVNAVLGRCFEAALLYGTVIYFIFYTSCRRLRRADVFFNITLSFALLGLVLCVSQILIIPAPKGDPGYTSIAHIPMNMNSLRWLGFVTDPLLLLPAFAFFYLERHRPQR